jgi:tetratricopeptide (TPR) repeat protein
MPGSPWARPRAWVAFLALGLAAHAARPAPPAPPEPSVDDVETRVRERLLERYRAVVDAPSDGEAWGRYGMALEAHRQLETARLAYEQAARLDAEDFRWPYYLGAMLEYRDPEGAVRWLENAVRLDEDYAPARIRLGEVLEKLGRVVEALRHFEQAERLDPRNALAPFGQGRIALASGDDEAAVAHLERAYRLDPRVQAIVVTLARALHRSGDEERARRLAAEARGLPRMTHHPDPRRAAVREDAVDTESFLQRARTQLEVGQPQRALAEVKHLLRDQPDHAEAHLLAAGIHDALGDAAAAANEAEAALRADPQLDRAHAVLAGALFKARRVDEAEREARRVLAQEPRHFHMLLIVALAAAERGDVATLVAHLDRAFEARTADPDLRRLLRQVLLDVASSFQAVGSRRQAALRLEQAIMLAREDGEPESVLAELRRRLEPSG